MNAENPIGTRPKVAVLGTLAEFHREPIPYNLTALVKLVSALHPDLLCLDLTPEQWQSKDFSALPPEYGEALLPLADQTDMVVVPVAGSTVPAELVAAGWKGTLVRWFRRWLAAIQRSAPTPDAVNSGWRHALADLLYMLIGLLAGADLRRRWRQHTRHVVQRVLEAAEESPGCRLLIVANVRHCHHIRHMLQGHSQLEVVKFDQL